MSNISCFHVKKTCNKRYILQPGITKRFIFKIKTKGLVCLEIVIISAM
ncbi:hypothetical protein EC08BKT77219_4711 [Escherichia coli 08BKT77219]|nr:hypothetical protein EC08BKT77219_4711 [Escherichia coli 08BKT77219]